MYKKFLKTTRRVEKCLEEDGNTVNIRCNARVIYIWFEIILSVYYNQDFFLISLHSLF
jgi:hypothetical protein